MEIKKCSASSHKIKALIYWASWVWKTVFWSTAPKPIFASAEAGMLSVASKWLEYVDIKSVDDLKDLLHYLKTEKHDYETVVIDSITEINEVIKLAIEAKNRRSMQLQDWGTLSKEIKSILRWFRDLDMHVLFIAQEDIKMDGEKILKINPSLNWKSATEVAYFMDIVWYLHVDKDWNRKVMTWASQKLLSKDRSSLLDDPDDLNFTSRCDKVKTMKIWEQKIVKEYTKWDEDQKLEEKKLPDFNDSDMEKLTTKMKSDTPPFKNAKEAIGAISKIRTLTPIQVAAIEVLLKK